MKFIVLILYFAVMIGIGIYCRKRSANVDGFVLGGRSVGPWLTAFAYGTSYFSAVIFVGYAGQFGWKYGLASTWIGLGNAFIGSLLAWNLLGRRTRIMTQKLSSATMPDFFGKRFSSKALKIAASVIVFIFLIPYTASLYNGLSRLFKMAFNMDFVWCIVIMAVLTGIYVLIGGYFATAINDFIQGIIMIGGIIAVVAAVLVSNGGLTEAISKLSAIPAESAPELSGAFVSFFGPQPIWLFGVVILTSLGTWGLPQMVGKFYAIKNEDAINKGTIISTLFAIIVAGGCYFLGGFGRLYSAEIEYSASGTPIYDSIVPTMISELSPIIISIVVVLVLSASMSTLSSLVLTSGSTITLDVIAPIMKEKATEKRKMLIVRLFIVFFIVVSSVLAVIQYRSSVTFIAQMMGISWGALAGAFLAPFLYSLYWKKVTNAAVWSSFIFGTGIMILQLVMNLAGVKFDNAVLNFCFSSSINTGVIAMVGGLIIVPVVSLITPNKNKEKVDEIFSCYSHKVTVNITDALESDGEN